MTGQGLKILVQFMYECSTKGKDQFDWLFYNFEFLKEEAIKLGEHRSRMLCCVAEFLLRASKFWCGNAGIFLHECLLDRLISPEEALNILERWERHPVEGFDPNLGANIYEHLFDHGPMQNAFEKWKNDPILRKQYISSAHALPENEGLDVYEWALHIGEKSSVGSSLEALQRDPVPKNTRFKPRWDKILAAVHDKKNPHKEIH
jgi:hypothetical protein